MRIDGKKTVTGLRRLTRSTAFYFLFFRIQTESYWEIITKHIVNFKHIFHIFSFQSLVYLYLTFLAKLLDMTFNVLHGASFRSPHTLSSCQSRTGISKPPCRSFSATGIMTPSHINWQFCLLPRLTTKPVTRKDKTILWKILEKSEVLYNVRRYHLSQLPSCYMVPSMGSTPKVPGSPPFPCCVTLGKLLYLSVSQFLPLSD